MASPISLEEYAMKLATKLRENLSIKQGYEICLEVIKLAYQAGRVSLCNDLEQELRGK